jgi:hypothetical protein
MRPWTAWSQHWTGHASSRGLQRKAFPMLHQTYTAGEAWQLCVLGLCCAGCRCAVVPFMMPAAR